MEYRRVVPVVLLLVQVSPCLSQCPPCKTLESCTSPHHSGSFLLMQEDSVFCPTTQGYTGCLYRKNGTSDSFCFKAGPSEECSAFEDCDTDTDSLPDISTILPPDFDCEPALVFPSYSLMTPEEQLGLCCSKADCQPNAGCFLDKQKSFTLTSCSCKVNFLLDTSTYNWLDAPRTGTCDSLAELGCSPFSPCYSEAGLTICPFCSVTREGEEIGLYSGGTGDLLHDDLSGDPMLFLGSSGQCEEEVTEMFWYCWYDASHQVVDLSQTMVAIQDNGPCQRWAYIYTPLACSDIEYPS